MNQQHLELETNHLEANLAYATVRGGAVTLCAQASLFTLGLTATAILARLLTPADFGLVAMASVFTSFMGLFKDFGLSAATVQRESLEHGQISTLFWLNLATGLGAMLVFAAVAPVIAIFYGEAELKWVVMALGATFVAGGLAAQHQALLRRQMRFTALASIEVGSKIVSIAAAVAFAWYGAGYWALVAMQLVNSITGLIWTWSISQWRPGLPSRRANIGSMLSFGGHLTGFNVINHLARNFDQLLIGGYWGAQTLGFYNRAYQLLLLPIQQINLPSSKVAVPALSRLQSDPVRYRRYYCKAMNVLAFATTPLIVAMAVLSDEIIIIVLGHQWLEASTIFKVLAIAALGQPLASATGWIYMSLGQTKRMMVWGLLSTPPLLLAFIVGLPWGAVGVAVAYAITDHLRRIPLFLFAFKESPIRMSDFIDATWRPTVISAFTWLVMSQTRARSLPSEPSWIIFYCLLGGIATLVLSVLCWPRARGEVVDILKIMNRVSLRIGIGHELQSRPT